MTQPTDPTPISPDEPAAGTAPSADRERLLVLAALVLAFFVGGVVGALGFQRLGYAMTVPLAVILIVLAIVPAADDIADYMTKPDA